MAIQTGDTAPPVKLPASFGEEIEARIGQGKVVLLFFPLAFSPVYLHRRHGCVCIGVAAPMGGSMEPSH